MAEMEVADKSGGGGRKKLSTRVDLTPMVDLGFLLITFFMFTTTLSQPKTLPYNTPIRDAKKENQNEIKESTVMTCLLSKNGRVYAYQGIGSADNPPVLQVLHFGNGEGSVREAFINFMTDVNQKKQAGLLLPDDKTMVLIKPDTNSTFNDLVGILDEVMINGINTQATIPITAVDRSFIQRTEAANNE